MISVARNSGLVTVINAFSCEPAQQPDLVTAWRDAEAELGMMPGVISAALHRSLDGTRVVNYGQLRSAQDWERLREVGQTKAYFDRITHFGQPDAHLYEVVYTRDRTATN
jgi:heme-degrading monooxygenase HmoA